MAQSPSRLALRDLSASTRAVIAVFLMAVGVGYLSALVQLSVQHATPPNILPDHSDASAIYAGKTGESQMIRILTASEEKAFNGAGTMTPAFTTKSLSWHNFVKAHGTEENARAVRDSERLALLDWIASGCDRTAYDQDRYTPSERFPASSKLPAEFLVRGPGPSQLERLLLTPIEGHPFNGEGQMRAALFDRSSAWKGKWAAANQAQRQKLMKEREGETQALVEWARQHGPEKPFVEDDFELPMKLKDQPLSEEYLLAPGHVKIQSLLQDRCFRCHGQGSRNGTLDEYNLIAAYTIPENDRGEVQTPKQVRIRSLITDRCVRCHQDARGADDRARKAPLDTYERFTAFCEPERNGGISFRQLAQSTHAHLLAFAVLFAMTGLIFSLTSWPGWIRFMIAPATLLFQVLEIGCWWASRWYPDATLGILVGGGVVGITLLIQIMGTYLDLLVFRRRALVNGNGNGGSDPV